MAALEAAAAALEQGDGVAALDLLLAAWRETRSPQIADQIDALTGVLTRSLAPVKGRTRKEFHEQWLDLANAHRALDVGRLVAEWTTQPWGRLRERVERFALRPEDPRIASAFARFIEALPTTNGAGDATWTAMLKALRSAGDVRCRGPIAARLGLGAQGVFWQELKPRLTRVLEALAAVEPVEVGAPALARVDAALAAFGQRPPLTEAALLKTAKAKHGSGPNEEELLARIYDQPADDAARLVYADFCSERGDLRGELIALQFKPRPTQKEQRRIRELLKAHGRAWLKDIEPAVEARSEAFTRGFVSACRLAFRTPAQREALLLHPAWNTVCRLWVWEDRDAFFLLPHPLKGLEELDGVLWPELAMKMARRPRPYPRLRRLKVELGSASAEQLRAVAEAAAFPALTWLGLHGTGQRDQPPRSTDAFAWLLASPLAPRLETIELSYLQVDLAEWLAGLRGLPKLQRLEVSGWPPISFFRDAGGWRARVHPVYQAAAGAEGVLAPLATAGLLRAVELAPPTPGEEQARTRLQQALGGVALIEARA